MSDTRSSFPGVLPFPRRARDCGLVEKYCGWDRWREFDTSEGREIEALRKDCMNGVRS
jgi:hypothetical protein